MSRPRIGIISYLEENKESVFRFRQNMINEAYTSALLESGAIPSIIPSIGDKEAIDLLLSSVDGILIPGGADVDPSLYGEENEGLSQKTNKDQDLFQKDIILRALDMHKCIMGICRGHQIVNVTLGGKLFQDITKFHLRIVKGIDCIFFSAVFSSGKLRLYLFAVSFRYALINKSMLPSSTAFTLLLSTLVR